ncbi:MAG: cytochrome c [Oscillochloridaceae bacterium]|nr:c-type cytochrome [Chloroflexaceae bacterium]MDW8390043.1 cytochrome c [Oscillochloridaceae bacterium]
MGVLLRFWRAGGRLATVFLVASMLPGCSAGPSTATLLDPPPVASPSPVPAPDDVEVGRQLFTGQFAVPGFVACIGCHSVDPASRAGIGPNLAAIAQVAGQRAPGMTAAEYIERSIRFHDEFVVPGYRAGIARGALGGRDFNDVLSDEQVAALVAYLMSLPANAPGANATTGVAAAPAAPRASAASPQLAASATATTTRATATASATSTATARATATTTASATSTPSVASTATPATTPTVTASATATTASTATATATPAGTGTPTASPTAIPVATVPPSPTPPPAPTPAPAPTPTVVAVAATPTPAPLPSAPDDPNLARYAGCVSCHNQHPQQVRMPHPLNPACNECHRGSPNRIGCPTCHSMHAVDNKHEPVPDLACATCHR